MKKFGKFLLTGIVLAIAAFLVLDKYWDYVENPWTRDGQVRAQVIQVTPRVSGPIVELPIQDNQPVKAGDLLFRIDPRTFQASLDQARAQLDNARNGIAALQKQVEVAEAAVKVSESAITRAESAISQMDSTIAKTEAEYQRQQDLLPKKATSTKAVQRAKASYEVTVQERIGAVAGLAQAKAGLAQSQASLAQVRAQLGATGEANPQVRAALAAVRQAELNLEFTEVRASVDGYVTNLTLRQGSQAVANKPVLALVDVNSYWVHGFFKETYLAELRPGDRAIVTLMTYPDSPLQGRVESIGWGIAQSDGTPGADLLPNISPTYEWIRLAQRVPVRVHLDHVPEAIKLRVGTTASVLVMKGTPASETAKSVPATPTPLR